MSLDIASTAFLAQMAAAGGPPLTTLSPNDARMVMSEMALLFAEGPEMAQVRDETIPCADGGSIRARVLTPIGEPRSVFVYYHGGGWVLGTIDEFDTLGRLLAERTQSIVVLVEYRKAPEHPFPIPVNDAWDALKWTHANMNRLAGQSLPIIVGGDSAGGNLTAVVCHRAKAAKGPDIALQLLVYPVTDCAMDTPSYQDPANQLLLSAESMQWFWDHYAPNPADREHPDASPLRAADFSGLPPALVITAEYDPLRSESEAYAKKLQEAGVPLVFKQFDRQMHNFFAMPGVLPAAAKALEFVGEQIDRHFAKQAVVDALVVGAGFAGLYQLYKLREKGLKTRVIEAADDVGGTWYWNRYPGARCDIESMEYSFSFSPELEQEWTWTEKYATQPEILKYAQYVAERFDLRKDITFNTRVARAVFDEDANHWVVHTDTGEAIAARYLIMATGCLSVPKVPDIPGADQYKGPVYVTGRWPHEGVDFTGQKVAVIGTGSSGIQSIPLIADEASQVTVYQRTAAYSMPAFNRPLTKEEIADVKGRYREVRALQKAHPVGVSHPGRAVERATQVNEAERRKRFEEGWKTGILISISGAYTDMLRDPEANKSAADFVRGKIAGIVKDPQTAEDLMPTAYPYAAKRVCLDTNYYETFNRDHVKLVNLRRTPIETITPTGIRTSEGEETFDAIVYATGFDAMTGAIVSVDIRGRGGVTLQDKWAQGPHSYLGLGVSGFPNFFTITGPSSPSVLSNMIVSIEQHVEWIADCIEWMQTNTIATIEPTIEAEDEWAQHTADLANMTLFPQADSWYMGANVSGKPRMFMAYVGGCDVYRFICDTVAMLGYEGFKTTPGNTA